MFAAISLIDLILYIELIIYYPLTGFLIYLIITNKLTYVDEFRQKFVIGVSLLLANTIILTIFVIIIKIPQEFSLILFIIMTLVNIGFMILTLAGISQLIDYISSIIEFETKNKKKYAILSSFVINIILLIINLVFNLRSSLGDLIISFLYPLFAFYCTIYTLLLHQEMKKIDLNILLYITLSFLCFAIFVFPSYIISAEDPAFWVNTLFIFIGLNIVLIIGYLDFKNKISKGLGK